MELLKVQVKKDIYEEIESGKRNDVILDLNQSLIKRMVKDQNTTKDDIINDVKTIKDFDQLYISCMFSPKNITFDIEDVKIVEDKIVFIVKNNADVVDVVEPVVEQQKVDETPAPVQKKEPVKEKVVKNKQNVSDRVYALLDGLEKDKNMFVVGSPVVVIKKNGRIFGIDKTLPIMNDQDIRIDIESDKLYFTYDMTEDDYINELSKYFKRMLSMNFVFLWRSKCVYKEVDGKRFLLLHYTTRRYINESKKLF